MDNFKKLVYSLKDEVSALQKKVGELEGRPAKTTGVHYVAPSMECGIHPMDDYDTWRFAVHKNIIPPNTPHPHPPTYEYFLTNPTKELNDIVCEIINNSKLNRIRICSENGPLDGIENNYRLVGTSMNSSAYYVDFTSKTLRELLDSKIWEFTIINISDRQAQFKRIIEINLENNYKIPPHISCYISPSPEIYNISYKIKDITTKKFIIEISYGAIDKPNHDWCEIILNKKFPPIIPDTTQLHWQASGIIEDKIANPFEPFE
jgi:hypothetical protein